MGEEISRRYFDAEHFSTFRARLDNEQELLRRHFERGEFSPRGDVAGFELEAWLVDRRAIRCRENERLSGEHRKSAGRAELAAYNVELNGSPCS